MIPFRVAALLLLLMIPFIVVMTACDTEGETNGLPDRIISLAPSTTEILFALDLGDQVVGVTNECDYPPDVQGKDSIGYSRNPDIDLILELDPDLVLATEEQTGNVISALRDKGIEVLIVNPRTFDELIMNIALVGVITGRSEESSRLVTDMENRLQKLTHTFQGNKPGVCYLSSHDPLRAAGSGTLIDELIWLSNGKNVFNDRSGMVQTTASNLASRNPEVILVAAAQSNQGDSLLDWVKNAPDLKQTDAVDSGRIYEIDETLVTRPGPRIIDGLELLAGLIHQENMPGETQ